MGLTYFKRFRMECDLVGRRIPLARLPVGYSFVAWHSSLVEAHAEAKYLSFRTEIDSNVFPCLGEFDGCHRLMHEIMRKDGFLAGATWLVVYRPQENWRPEYCATVQGVKERAGVGAVQNLGVVPEHRERGLGTALMLKALEGFRSAGLHHVHLEVTARNEGAVRLYQRLGFNKVRTLYKAVEVAYS